MIGKVLYFQKDEWVQHMVCSVFVENKRSLGYVNGVSYVQRILESCASNISA